jgi:hypothetical protein
MQVGKLFLIKFLSIFSLAREATRFLKEKFITYLSSVAFIEADMRSLLDQNLFSRYDTGLKTRFLSFSRMAFKCSSPSAEQIQPRSPLLLLQSPNYNLAQILFINFICIILSKCNIVSSSSSINKNSAFIFLSVDFNFWGS